MIWLVYIVALFSACSSDPDGTADDVSANAAVHDGGRSSEGSRKDAGRPADAAATDQDEGEESDEEADARALSIQLLEQFNRGAQIGCPCKAKRRDFASEKECIAAIGYKKSDIECVSESVRRSTARMSERCWPAK